MINEKIASENYRKFLYFFKNNLAVHFKDLDEIFYNGIIIDLSKEKNTMVLNEKIKGTIPILLEFVNPDSISQYKERGE